MKIIGVLLLTFVLLISGCTNDVQTTPEQIQTSDTSANNVNIDDTQDDIVYVDKDTEFIASTLKFARHYLKGNLNQKSQEDDASAVEMLGEYFDGEIRERFAEVAKYIRLGDKEKVQQLCDEIEAEYVTKYSWKRNS
ncbi:hypothetical protein P4H71_07090 [Paenibacillus kribbensis]|uniref:hypothetical protein n=1 Tax=Paenibacillus kribbensis TaxID=172713 RepID=UPI002DBA9673|nr:hypothetical protein [Paenibacillus kribbensis]MEC0234096.1 hypothetical protein [Paenibacillus kribbensis]